MYVNNEDKSEIVEFDPQALKETHPLEAHWLRKPLRPRHGQEKSPGLFGRLRIIRKMAVMGTPTPVPSITTLPIGDGPSMPTPFDPEDHDRLQLQW